MRCCFEGYICTVNIPTLKNGPSVNGKKKYKMVI